MDAGLLDFDLPETLIAPRPAILSLRWLDRAAIWAMSESVRYECFTFTHLPQA
jgi:hypothetical protein